MCIRDSGSPITINEAWEITVEERAKLAAGLQALKPVPSTVFPVMYYNTQDSRNFAQDLRDIFRDNGWEKEIRLDFNSRQVPNPDNDYLQCDFNGAHPLGVALAKLFNEVWPIWPKTDSSSEWSAIRTYTIDDVNDPRVASDKSIVARCYVWSRPKESVKIK